MSRLTTVTASLLAPAALLGRLIDAVAYGKAS
jgi:hypothetical protein